MAALLEIKNAFFKYRSNSNFAGLQKINLSLNLGESLVIMGESGCGKSSLLQCMAGLQDLEHGEIWINKNRQYGPSQNLVADFEYVRLVNQQEDLLTFHTCLENVIDRLNFLTNEEKHKRANYLLNYFDLKDFANQKANTLSTGQRQRLSIARSLAKLPKLLLLDEPFSNLDTNLKNKALTIINKAKQKKKLAYILVTHQPDDAMRNADTIAVMNEGKFVQIDTADNVYYKPKTKYCAGLLGAYNLIPKALVTSKAYHAIGSKAFFRPNDKKLIELLKKSTSTQRVFNSFNFENEVEWKEEKLMYYSAE